MFIYTTSNKLHLLKPFVAKVTFIKQQFNYLSLYGIESLKKNNIIPFDEIFIVEKLMEGYEKRRKIRESTLEHVD